MVPGDVDHAVLPCLILAEHLQRGVLCDFIANFYTAPIHAVPVTVCTPSEFVVRHPLAAQQITEDCDVRRVCVPVQSAVDVREIVVVAEEVEALAKRKEGDGKGGSEVPCSNG